MNVSRRTFLKTASVLSLGSACGCLRIPARQPTPILVNDVHTELNPTYVRNVNRVDSLPGLRQAVKRAKQEGRSLSIAGGRHAAGGQQFGTDIELIDTCSMQQVLHFDHETGLLDVETGIQWPAVMKYLIDTQARSPHAWTIAQKQTGTDQLSVGGALSANAHGRGLNLPPFISNVESFVLVDANGDCHTCSRRENPELFKLAIGGYGLFGFIYSAQLRLVPRRKVRRIVAMIDTEDLPAAFAGRIRDGFIYGDFQFAIDSQSDDFLRRGILSCYEPVADDTPMPADHRKLSGQDWKDLLYLAHTSPSTAFDKYAAHYLSTSGQLYWSDTQYVSDYFEHYHRELDVRLGAKIPATEVIGELYVPRESLPRFLRDARDYLRASGVPLIYGTIRLIEQDTESFLPWAKQSYGCVIFNLHTPHSPAGMTNTADAFRRLIDLAAGYGGSYYLTYHRYATRGQVEMCYPQFQEFLRLKSQYDPDGRFQSDWYRHHRKMFA